MPSTIINNLSGHNVPVGLVCQISVYSQLTFNIHSPGHSLHVCLVCQISVHSKLTFFIHSLGHSGEIQSVCQMITYCKIIIFIHSPGQYVQVQIIGKLGVDSTGYPVLPPGGQLWQDGGRHIPVGCWVAELVWTATELYGICCIACTQTATQCLQRRWRRSDLNKCYDA